MRAIFFLFSLFPAITYFVTKRLKDRPHGGHCAWMHRCRVSQGWLRAASYRARFKVADSTQYRLNLVPFMGIFTYLAWVPYFSRSFSRAQAFLTGEFDKGIYRYIL